jgi:hypothetical protein
MEEKVKYIETKIGFCTTISYVSTYQDPLPFFHQAASMTGVIYMITNTVNGKNYIGQTWRLRKRIQQHMYAGTQSDLHIDIKSLGRDKFEFTIIDTADSASKLNALERHYICQYDTMTLGYNRDPGGGGSSTVTTKNVCFFVSFTVPGVSGSCPEDGRKAGRAVGGRYAP